MGQDIAKTSFNEGDYQAFHGKLENNLAALRQLISRPGFGEGRGSLGAELEMYIIDPDGHPLCANQEILDNARDPLLTLELNRYNLEYNLAPYSLDNQPFFNTERDIRNALNRLEKLAHQQGGRMAIVGILPTLRQQDFGAHSMTNRRRYQALVKQLLAKRGCTFKVHINGANPLQLEMEDVTLEGANTSFQVHYRVAPKAFADTYNTLQMMTPLALALAANSPTLFGHSLWHETRIPLFKQSIDIRNTDRYHWHPPPRVNFGNGWVRRGAFELFNETVRSYAPILPLCSDEDALQIVNNHGVPKLSELRLQQSSVWLWNRPVYDDAEGGHLRIEMRALPAGPTAVDMVANAALLIGLTEGARDRINQLLPGLPFHLAEYNFYRAAQHGLEAKLVWPSDRQSGCQERRLMDVLEELLPVAREGLRRIGISGAEIDHYLAVIEQRLDSGQTGAVWQAQTLTRLEREHSRHRALHLMLERLVGHGHSNRPVGEWPLDD